MPRKSSDDDVEGGRHDLNIFSQLPRSHVRRDPYSLPSISTPTPPKDSRSRKSQQACGVFLHHEVEFSFRKATLEQRNDEGTHEIRRKV